MKGPEPALMLAELPMRPAPRPRNSDPWKSQVLFAAELRFSPAAYGLRALLRELCAVPGLLGFAPSRPEHWRSTSVRSFFHCGGGGGGCTASTSFLWHVLVARVWELRK